MTVYVIKLNAAEYVQFRGGWDWGRTDRRYEAAVFTTRKEAAIWQKMTGGKIYKRYE